MAGWLNPKLCAQTDKTFLAAALRETREEVGIVPDQVEILGQVGPPQLSLGGLRVWPYVVRSSRSIPSIIADVLFFAHSQYHQCIYRVSFTPRLNRGHEKKPMTIQKLR